MIAQDNQKSIQKYFLPEGSPQAKNYSYSPERIVLEEFNKKYAVVHANTTFVLFEKEIGEYVLDTRQSLINFHENNNFIDSSGKLLNKAKFWLKHPARRTYSNLVFNPIRPGHYIMESIIYFLGMLSNLKKEIVLYIGNTLKTLFVQEMINIMNMLENGWLLFCKNLIY